MKVRILALVAFATVTASAEPVSHAVMADMRRDIGFVNRVIRDEAALLQRRCKNQQKRKAVYDRGLVQRETAVAPLLVTLEGLERDLALASSVEDALRLDRAMKKAEVRSLAARLSLAAKNYSDRLRAFNDLIRAATQSHTLAVATLGKLRDQLAAVLVQYADEIAEAKAILEANPGKDPAQVLSKALYGAWSMEKYFVEQVADAEDRVAELLEDISTLEAAKQVQVEIVADLRDAKATAEQELKSIESLLKGESARTRRLEQSTAAMRHRIRILSKFQPVSLSPVCAKLN